MKKTLILFFTIIGLTLSAQQEAPPQGINYQAVVYSDNGNNQPGLNHQVRFFGMKISAFNFPF